MARPGAVARLLYYPFPAECLPLLFRHLETGDEPEEITIFDPCAGKGIAALALADHLKVPDANVYLVELDGERAQAIREARPNANLLGPCSFMGTQISYNGFSLVYVNPPYSDEMGGGRREELTFVVNASNLVAHGGLMVAVLPEQTLFDYGSPSESMRNAIDSRFKDVQVYALPAEHRNYRELVVFGTKRNQMVPKGEGALTKDEDWAATRRRVVGELGKPSSVYKLKKGLKPKRFWKVDFTEAELIEEVKDSPLATLLEPPEPIQPPQPLITLGQGHIVLVLVSGYLDGLVFPEGEPPHVIRGTAKKIQRREHDKCTSTVDEDGRPSSKEVYIDDGVRTFRALGVDGVIYNFTDQPEA